MIDRTLRASIEEKKQIIARHPRGYVERKRIIDEGLRSIGDVHSFWIENPELQGILLRTRSPRSVKEARKGIAAIKNGWHYLMTQFGPNIRESIDHPKVKKLNKIISDPWRSKKCKGVDYRNRSVVLGFEDYIPPKHENVPELMQELFDELRDPGRDDLESAIYVHLRIAGIQPFEDGNKRTARLIQDALLVRAGYSSAVIYAGEGTFYFNLLGEALAANDKGKVVGQRGFYDFIASKVNEAFDEIIGHLDVDDNV